MIFLSLGSMYKFKFENAAVANIWFQRLKEASTFKQNNGRTAENLIALDWFLSTKTNSSSCFGHLFFFSLLLLLLFFILENGSKSIRHSLVTTERAMKKSKCSVRDVVLPTTKLPCCSSLSFFYVYFLFCLYLCACVSGRSFSLVDHLVLFLCILLCVFVERKKKKPMFSFRVQILIYWKKKKKRINKQRSETVSAQNIHFKFFAFLFDWLDQQRHFDQHCLKQMANLPFRYILIFKHNGFIKVAAQEFSTSTNEQ